MRRLIALSVVASLLACGGSDGGTNPGTGPLAIAIISGNNQVASAGNDSLPEPVVGKLVRKPDGSVAWVRELPSRALDVLVPRAFAQGTVVNGSPVAGAVVCAVSTDPLHKLTPFVPCTNTDDNGQAVFFFTTDTVAGVSTAEIRGTVNSEPVVFDTASAIVVPDTSSGRLFYKRIGSDVYAYRSVDERPIVMQLWHASDSVVLARPLVISAADKYGNVMTDYTIGWTLTQLTNETLTLDDTVPRVLPYPSVQPGDPPTSPASTASVVTGFRPGYAVLWLYVDGHYTSANMFAVLP